MASRSTNITVINNTGCDLVLVRNELFKGKWSVNSIPPSLINVGNIGIWQSENDTTLSGTKGIVQYLIKDSKNKLTIEWNNPIWGLNRYKISILEYFQVKRLGGIGNNAMIAITILAKQITR